MLYSPDAANEYAHPRRITDRNIIDSYLNSGDPNKIYSLIDDAELTNEDLLKILELSNSSNNYNWWVAINPNCNSELLNEFLTSKDERLVSIALQHSNVPFEKFYNAVMKNTYAPNKKFSVASLENFAYSGHTFKSLEVFKKLWENQRIKKSLVLGAESAVFRNSALTIDRAIIDFLAKEIVNENNTLRAEYARSSILSDPVTLDLMKTDSHRPVITSLAWNKRACPATHKYILDNHKSASIKDGIAFSSSDNNLLNRIYKSTKSEQTKLVIENNSNFFKIP